MFLKYLVSIHVTEYGSKTDMVGRSRTAIVMMMLETANNGRGTITKNISFSQYLEVHDLAS